MTKPYLHVASGVDVTPLALDLHRQPQLWDKNPCRLHKESPHHDSHDIFLHYKDETPNIKTGDWHDWADAHIPDWYFSINLLPSARPLIFDLMHLVSATMLGGVFIYKVDSGKQINPHTDYGWHAQFYDKFNICIQSNPESKFVYDNDSFVQTPGDIHMFRNDVPHSVVNNGDTDHIVMIVCARTDRGYRVPWSPEGWTRDLKEN